MFFILYFHKNSQNFLTDTVELSLKKKKKKEKKKTMTKTWIQRKERGEYTLKEVKAHDQDLDTEKGTWAFVVQSN